MLFPACAIVSIIGLEPVVLTIFYIREGAGMTFDAGTWWLAVLLLGGLSGVCVWMFKRSADKSDREFSAVRADIREIQRTYTPRDVHDKDIAEYRKAIEDIRKNYLTKEDFLREQAKTERKLDKIIDMLMERREASK